MAGGTVNLYSDSGIQGALVTGDDIAVKVKGNHNIVLLSNLSKFIPKNHVSNARFSTYLKELELLLTSLGK